MSTKAYIIRNDRLIAVIRDSADLKAGHCEYSRDKTYDALTQRDALANVKSAKISFAKKWAKHEQFNTPSARAIGKSYPRNLQFLIED